MRYETKNKIKDFYDLVAWQKSHQVVLLTYELTKKFPRDELFGLVSQMRRASVSITSNIAEGFGRNSYKERAQFYSQARGSLSELKNQSVVAKDLNYVNESEYTNLIEKLSTSHQLLQGLITKTRIMSSHTS